MNNNRYDVYAAQGTPAGEYVLALARLIPHDAELDRASGGTDDDDEILLTFRAPDAR